jgi:cyclophilin family peptidyl-prolyl cis-trans isomerase
MRILFVLLAILGVATSGFTQQAAYKVKSGETVLKLEITSRGTVYIKLATKEAPKTTAQIIKLAKSGFYDGLRFHRVEKSPKPYLVQVGDPASKADLDKANNGGSGSTLSLETNSLSHTEGAVGLAMTEGKGDSQFYIMLGSHKFLDGKYTVFGQVVNGMDVVKAIEKGDKIKAATIVTG